MSYQNYGSGYSSDPNQGLPEGWLARFHDETKHWFYVHEGSGRTQWERPGYDSGYGQNEGQYAGGGQYGGQQQGYPVDERGYHQGMYGVEIVQLMCLPSLRFARGKPRELVISCWRFTQTISTVRG